MKTDRVRAPGLVCKITHHVSSPETLSARFAPFHHAHAKREREIKPTMSTRARPAARDGRGGSRPTGQQCASSAAGARTVDGCVRGDPAQGVEGGSQPHPPERARDRSPVICVDVGGDVAEATVHHDDRGATGRLRDLGERALHLRAGGAHMCISSTTPANRSGHTTRSEERARLAKARQRRRAT